MQLHSIPLLPEAGIFKAFCVPFSHVVAGFSGCDHVNAAFVTTTLVTDCTEDVAVVRLVTSEELVERVEQRHGHCWPLTFVLICSPSVQSFDTCLQVDKNLRMQIELLHGVVASHLHE